MRRAWPSKIDMLPYYFGSCILTRPRCCHWSRRGRTVGRCWIIRPGRVKSQHGLSRLERVGGGRMSSSTYYATRRIFNSARIVSGRWHCKKKGRNRKRKRKNEKKRGAASKNSIPPRYWHYCTACGAGSKGRDWLFYCTFNWDCQSACSFPGSRSYRRRGSTSNCYYCIHRGRWNTSIFNLAGYSSSSIA